LAGSPLLDAIWASRASTSEAGAMAAQLPSNPAKEIRAIMRPVLEWFMEKPRGFEIERTAARHWNGHEALTGHLHADTRRDLGGGFEAKAQRHLRSSVHGVSSPRCANRFRQLAGRPPGLDAPHEDDDERGDQQDRHVSAHQVRARDTERPEGQECAGSGPSHEKRPFTSTSG
jgi:hypothetical protein